MLLQYEGNGQVYAYINVQTSFYKIYCYNLVYEYINN